MDLPALQPFTKNLAGPEYIRVREKSTNGFFGKIFRDGKKTLKQNKITDHSSIVVQVMESAEQLEKESYVIWLSKRDSEK